MEKRPSGDKCVQTSVRHVILDSSVVPARFGCLHCGHRAEAFRFPATLLAFTDSINAYIRDHARCEARPS
jgi:hypothetical protein